mmetsp:Transcript_5362/g.7733  ORF Transcript_5362/g.7733 Transcript_5362/m.7733 type:complete len:309 (-) Transcript_5362:272-1198(-)
MTAATATAATVTARAGEATKKPSDAAKRTNNLDWITWAMAVTWAILLTVLVHQRTHLLRIFYFFIFFGAINVSIQPSGLSLLPLPASLEGKSDKHQLFINTLSSLIHSAMCSCLVIYLLANEQERSALFDGNMFETHTDNSILLLSMTTGYMAYDLWHWIKAKLYVNSTSPIVLHHIVLLTCFTTGLVRVAGTSYLVLTLLCEINSCFLHLRTIGKTLNLLTPGSMAVKALWFGGLWPTMASSRVGAHLWIAWKVFQDRALFPHTFLFCMAFFGMCVFNVLNVDLIISLSKACKRECRWAPSRPMKKK